MHFLSGDIQPVRCFSCSSVFLAQGTSGLLICFVVLTGAMAPTQVIDRSSKLGERPADFAGETIVRGSDIGRVKTPFELKMKQVDPEVDGWTTEALADSIGQQLKAIASVLISGEELNEPTVKRLVTDGIETSGLRPSGFRPVFSDDRLVIRRTVSTNAETSNVQSTNPTDAQPTDAQPTDAQPINESRGVVEFIQSLRDFTSQCSLTPDSRVEFKVIHVNVCAVDDKVNTTVLLHVASRHPDRIVQQNATWQCEWLLNSETAPRLSRLAVDELEEVVNLDREPLFSDCTSDVVGHTSGFQQQLALSHDYWRKQIETHRGVTWTGSHGLAMGDVNGDRLDDVYICQTGGLPNRLFVQRADGKADEVAHASGVDILDSTTSALFLDLDNDGDQDLVVAVLSKIVFMNNNGSGKFTHERSLPVLATPSSMAAADYDNDGLLDVYVCFSAIRNNGMPRPYHDANNGAPNSLFRQVSEWEFKDVTKEVSLDENNHRFSMAAAWEDFDNDGDLDLYVANDFGRNNLYQYDEERFHDVAKAVGVEDVAAGMSVSWGDYDGDGSMDLYVGNMFSAAGNRITYQDAFKQGVDANTRDMMRRHARGNSLFKNTGDGGFQDVSLSTDVTMGRWAWSSLFFDSNNDGKQDIFVANGLATQEDTSDL